MQILLKEFSPKLEIYPCVMILHSSYLSSDIRNGRNSLEFRYSVLHSTIKAAYFFGCVHSELIHDTTPGSFRYRVSKHRYYTGEFLESFQHEIEYRCYYVMKISVGVK